MPAILDRISAAPGFHFSPKKVIVLSDLAPEGWRRMVAERLFIRFEDVLDLFGSTEIGAIAYYEAQTGLYHFHEHIIPELQLLPRSCPGGTFNADAGVLVVTSL
jgi:phenylacetate-coenzyme A ligase PaaK-like adenylate-forming protein